MNAEILKNIGLTDGESKVYLALIKLGSATSGPITDESGVSRSKIYNILDRLIKKGLVSYIVKEKTKYFQAENPEKIKDFLDDKEQEFKEQRIEVEKLIPQLALKQQLSDNKEEVKVFKGFKGLQSVHEHMYSKLKKGDSFFYMGIPSFQDKKYDLYWQRDHKRREQSGLVSRSLFNQGTPKSILKNRNSYKGMDARYMPFPIESPAWFMGYKGVIVIGLQSDNLAIEISNQKIADSFKEYFETMWKLSKKFTS